MILLKSNWANQWIYGVCLQNTGKRFLPGAQVTPKSSCTVKSHSIMDNDHTRVASWSICSQASTSCVLWYLPRSRVDEEGQTAGGVNSPIAIYLTSLCCSAPHPTSSLLQSDDHVKWPPAFCSPSRSKSSVTSLVTWVEPVFPVSQEVSVTFQPFLLSYSKSP